MAQTTTTYHNALQMGSMLLEYRLESVLGAGGFGMTYLGWDTHLEKHVAIKEYLPTDLAVRALDGSVVPITTELQHDYKWGLDRFILEARTLARFSHPHIVRVNRYFEANGTGYMVMDYEKGESLSQILKGGPPDEARLKGLLMPLLDGLQAVHSAGFLHRDIKPANIFVRESGSPVLIDFGASRQAVGGATKSMTAVLTPGYAPLEQYASDGNQGPWTDIYAMAGVLYRAFAADNPPDAVSRMKSDTVPGKLAALRGRVSEPLLRSVEWALALDEHQRPQSIPEWKRALEGAATAPAVPRPAAQAATTVLAAMTGRGTQSAASSPSIPKTMVEPRRPMRRPPEEPRSGWRWAGIAAALLLAAVVAAGWNKHRVAKEREQDEAAKAEAERAAEYRRDLERSAAMRQRAEDEMRRLSAPPSGPMTPESRPADAAVDAPAAPKPAMAAAEPHQPPFRERPERERDDRPGPASENRDKMEKMRGAEGEFRSADADGDGYLTPDEVRGRFPLLEREFQRVDANGDGRLSLQELHEFKRMRTEMPPFKKKW
jgi:serine/threonine protein kinase